MKMRKILLQCGVFKKPNPTLAPLQQPVHVPNLSGMSSKPPNIEAMIPSVDELRKRRGDLQPLHHIHGKRNNSYDSQD